eukprot:453206-Alexandrium_andersonii.AAC.1
MHLNAAQCSSVQLSSAQFSTVQLKASKLLKAAPRVGVTLLWSLAGPTEFGLGPRDSSVQQEAGA